jgi:uncharacterized protein YyaL (SSP411 family)
MNRLGRATSPYLLQHANNPVDWWEWGDGAFAEARATDRPILLSVGYAACHWCHVMAHESFEDPGTAAFMNERFVNVKVDREERPDVDAIYMDAVQAMTGQGGWPMTVFLTPGGEPFFAGTYYPDEPRHGMPSFTQVLGAIAQAWRDQREATTDQAARVTAALRRSGSLRPSHDPLTEEILLGAMRGLTGAFDAEWGGFGPAPKFPQPMTLEFLLRMHLRGTPGALDMVTRTLDRMANGGIHDQLGGGFHRYAVDGRWHVPHFEKMLYDNAQLARLYLHAFQVTGREPYRGVVARTLDYLLREMRHADGGFFSSQDADSEGVEGRFFAWPYDELVSVAGEGGGAIAAFFGALPEGNWEGTNVLWRPEEVGVVAERQGVPVLELGGWVLAALPGLFDHRETRVRPGTDDKILACWNGLAASAFAEAARVLGEPRYADAAAGAAGFVLTRLRDGTGRLQRSWREGRTSGAGFIEDHAMMAAACLELYQTTFDPRWMRDARSLADEMVELFHDEANGGFFQVSADAGAALLTRPKELFDNAVPSGNSVAAEVLLRLALLTGDGGYERIGVSALRLDHELMTRAPSAFGHALGALDLYLSRTQEVAIVGDAGSSRDALVREVWGRYRPNVVLAVAAPDDGEAIDAVPLLADRPTVDGRATAYVCEGFVCRMPATTPESLSEQLGSSGI